MQERRKSKGKEIDILERRAYKNRTIVLGKDKRQHMVGIQGKRDIVWRKYFGRGMGIYKTDYDLAKAYFDDPDKWGGDFGFLVDEGRVIVATREYKKKTLVLARDVYQWIIGWQQPNGDIKAVRYLCGDCSDQFYRRHPNLIGKPMNDIAKAYFDNPDLFEEDFGVLTS